MKNLFLTFVSLCSVLLLAGCSDVPEYNLVIHFSMDSEDEHLEYMIQDARLNCSSIPPPDGTRDSETNELLYEIEPTSPKSWCGVKALNVPSITVNKSIDLFFFVEPSPLSSSIELTDDWSYDTPRLFLEIDGVQTAVGTENINNNEWKASSSLFLQR